MSISLYFGLPGCGKTTLMVKHAYKVSCAIEKDRKRVAKGKSKLCPYDIVLSNVPIALPNVLQIKFDDLGRYHITNALILIDEATLEADSRSYKVFPEHTKMFFLLHRHFSCDCRMYTQQWDGIDKKIRVCTDRCYYLYKKPLLGKWFTQMYRVPYGIIIPDPKKSDSEKLGEIIQGYCKPNILIRLFTPPVYRPKYYKYFDSWDIPKLPPHPKKVVREALPPLLS